MSRKIFLLLFGLVFLTGCASTPPESTFTIAPDVRASSTADDILFVDVLARPGGVGFANKTLYPSIKSSVVTKIEVLTPYDGNRVGSERWYVTHEGVKTVSYLVKYIPDNKGGTYFSVTSEK